MSEKKNVNCLSGDQIGETPVVEILDEYEYVSDTKVIATVRIKGPRGEIKRTGKFSRTPKGGYMFG